MQQAAMFTRQHQVVSAQLRLLHIADANLPKGSIEMWWLWRLFLSTLNLLSCSRKPVCCDTVQCPTATSQHEMLQGDKAMDVVSKKHGRRSRCLNRCWAGTKAVWPVAVAHTQVLSSASICSKVQCVVCSDVVRWLWWLRGLVLLLILFLDWKPSVTVWCLCRQWGISSE